LARILLTGWVEDHMLRALRDRTEVDLVPVPAK